MTDHRQQMLDIIGGGTPAGPVFVPRLDIWFNANRARGTLPREFAGKSLAQGTADMGLGLHSVVPAFLNGAGESDIHHRALGFYNHPDFPHVADFSAVPYKVERTARELITRYFLPGGQITTRIFYNEQLFASGSSIPDITEPAVKSPADYALLAELFRRVRIVPRPQGYERYRQRLGSAGLAVAHVSLACSPVHHIMRDLRKVEDFFLDMYDDFAAIQPLLEALGTLYDQLLDCALRCTAEVVLFGANYDDTITNPPLFEQHFLPWLAKTAGRLHGAGKYLLTHTDGENLLLSKLYPRCGFDVADSVCPAPMTKMSLADYRTALGKNVTIWGGISSILMLPSLVKEDDFRTYVGAMLAGSKPHDHLIFSIADTAPPDMDWGRFLYLRDQIAGYGK